MDFRNLASRKVAYLRAESTKERALQIEAISDIGTNEARLTTAQACVDMAVFDYADKPAQAFGLLNRARKLGRQLTETATYRGEHTHDTLQAEVLVADLPIVKTALLQKEWPTRVQLELQQFEQTVAASRLPQPQNLEESALARYEHVQASLATKLLLSRFILRKVIDTQEAFVINSLFSQNDIADQGAEGSQWNVSLYTDRTAPFDFDEYKLKVATGQGPRTNEGIVGLGMRDIFSSMPEATPAKIIWDINAERTKSEELATQRLDDYQARLLGAIGIYV